MTIRLERVYHTLRLEDHSECTTWSKYTVGVCWAISRGSVRTLDKWPRQPRYVYSLHVVHSLWAFNVFSNRHEMSEFEGLGLDDVELLTATNIRLTEQLFCEWRAYRNRLCLEKAMENFVYRYLMSYAYYSFIFSLCTRSKFVLYFCFVTIFCTFCRPFYQSTCRLIFRFIFALVIATPTRHAFSGHVCSALEARHRGLLAAL